MGHVIEPLVAMHADENPLFSGQTRRSLSLVKRFTSVIVTIISIERAKDSA
jgi:hypothetical protein